MALRVLLSLIKYNQQRMQELENCHGLSMVHQVLTNARCTVGFHILKVRPRGVDSRGVLRSEILDEI